MAKFAPRLRARAIWKPKSLKLAWSEHFSTMKSPKFAPRLRARTIWKLRSQKFAPRLRARAIWKSKSLKTESLGRLLEVDFSSEPLLHRPAALHQVPSFLVLLAQAASSQPLHWNQPVAEATAPSGIAV